MDKLFVPSGSLPNIQVLEGSFPWVDEQANEALKPTIEDAGASDSLPREQPLSSSQESRIRKEGDYIKGPWTDEEDALLKSLVAQHGPQNWSRTIAEKVVGRNGKQCRERWYNNLDPSIRKDPWSADEDEILRKAHAELGNRWADIALLLPGRPSNTVKNRWHTTLKKREGSRREPAKRKDAEPTRRTAPLVMPKRQKTHSSSFEELPSHVELPHGSPSKHYLPTDVHLEPDPPAFVDGCVLVRITDDEQAEWLAGATPSRHSEPDQFDDYSSSPAALYQPFTAFTTFASTPLASLF